MSCEVGFSVFMVGCILILYSKLVVIGPCHTILEWTISSIQSSYFHTFCSRENVYLNLPAAIYTLHDSAI